MRFDGLPLLLSSSSSSSPGGSSPQPQLGAAGDGSAGSKLFSDFLLEEVAGADAASTSKPREGAEPAVLEARDISDETPAGRQVPDPGSPSDLHVDALRSNQVPPAPEDSAVGETR